MPGTCARTSAIFTRLRPAATNGTLYSRRNSTISRAEQPLAQERVRVMDELRREVLRRPARQVDVDLQLVQRDGDRFVLPRERRVRKHDLERREVDGDVVHVDRVRVLEP